MALIAISNIKINRPLVGQLAKLPSSRPRLSMTFINQHIMALILVRESERLKVLFEVVDFSIEMYCVRVTLPSHNTKIQTLKIFKNQ